jgi:hypothetical protein
MKELIRHILKEETEEIDKNVMNFLMRRYEVKEINIDDRIRFKNVYFNVDGEFYSIGTFDNKKRQVRLILNMLEDNNVTEPIDNFSNENNPYRQKVIRTIKMFLSKVM